MCRAPRHYGGQRVGCVADRGGEYRRAPLAGVPLEGGKVGSLNLLNQAGMGVQGTKRSTAGLVALHPGRLVGRRRRRDR